MVRRYADRPVDAAIVDRMLDNATHAPSAGFTQGWEFLVLDTPADVARFWMATTPDTSVPNAWLDGMRTAPVVIVPMSDKGAYVDRYAQPDKQKSGKHTPDWPVPYWHMDAAMASLLILQTAVDEGLGACFFGVPGERTDAFRAQFGVPDSLKPIGAITVGHRLADSNVGVQGSAARRERRTNVVHRGRYRT